MTSAAGPGTGTDKTADLDMVVIRSHLERLSLPLRWCTTDLMLSDGLTKNSADAADLLRSALRTGRYTLAPESKMLEEKFITKQQYDEAVNTPIHLDIQGSPAGCGAATRS